MELTKHVFVGFPNHSGSRIESSHIVLDSLNETSKKDFDGVQTNSIELTSK